MWVKDKDCQRVILESWNGGTFSSFIKLSRLVERCDHSLTKWNKEVYGNLQYKIKQKQLEIEKLITKISRMKEANAIEKRKKNKKID